VAKLVKAATFERIIHLSFKTTHLPLLLSLQLTEVFPPTIQITHGKLDEMRIINRRRRKPKKGVLLNKSVLLSYTSNSAALCGTSWKQKARHSK